MADKLLDYTSRDYESFRQSMIDKIPEKMPEWTDRSDSDAGIVILELLAYGLETLSYYNDRVANEAYLDSSTQRKSVIKHCKLIDYDLSWQTASKLFQVFEFVPQPKDIVIPKGTMLGTETSIIEDSVVFETLTDLIIPAGKTGLEQDGNGEYLYKVEIEHGQTIKNEQVGFITSDDAFQEFKLKYGPVLKDSLKVYISEGGGHRLWQPVDDFISSNQESEHYQRYMNELDECLIQFGSGSSGRKPPLNSTIYADYKIGGGEEGNVGAETVTVLFEAIPGLVRTFNPTSPHVEGEDKESMESAKINGPASLKRLERYVSLSDYETGIPYYVKGISKIKAVNVNGDVALYVVPDLGETVSTTLQNEILADVEERKIMFTTVTVNNATFVTVNVSVNLTIYDNYDAETVRYGAENIIRDMLAKENVTFGESFKIGELYKKLFDIEGVRNVQISSPTGDVAIGNTSLPKLGTLSVLVGGN